MMGDRFRRREKGSNIVIDKIDGGKEKVSG
jgi:hypothetical protein